MINPVDDLIESSVVAVLMQRLVFEAMDTFVQDTGCVLQNDLFDFNLSLSHVFVLIRHVFNLVLVVLSLMLQIDDRVSTVFQIDIFQ